MWPFKNWSIKTQESFLDRVPFLDEFYDAIKSTKHLVEDLKKERMSINDNRQNLLLRSFYLGVVEGVLTRFFVIASKCTPEILMNYIAVAATYVAVRDDEIRNDNELAKFGADIANAMNDEHSLWFFKQGQDFAYSNGMHLEILWNEMLGRLTDL